MRKTLTAMILLLITMWGCTPMKHHESPKVNLILDTDLGPDYDDVGAMAVMHALADSGLVDILATVSSNRNEMTIPCVEIINRYFGRPNIPLGVVKLPDAVSLECPHKYRWTDSLPTHYPHSTLRSSLAPDAVAVYRRVLASQPDGSVTICTIGSLTNLMSLLQSLPDSISPLTGRDLVARKVTRLVSMAGMFPEGREYNIYSDATAARTVVENWPGEITFCGFEIGYNIITGRVLGSLAVNDSPVKDVYALSMSQGEPQGRWSWDQATVLAAILGEKPFYTSRRGTMLVDEDGNNTWQPSPHGTHSYLVPAITYKEMETVIENLMIHQPQPSFNNVQ